MPRLLPETEIEKKMMSMAAVFIEENQILEELMELVGEDTIEQIQSDEGSKKFALEEISEAFFRLDFGLGSEIKDECIEVLQELWKVSDKLSALKVLEEIRTQGHRTKFNVLKSCVADHDRISAAGLEKFKQIFTFDFPEDAEIELNDEQFRQLATWVQKTDRFVGACGILAWDTARLVQLCRLSYCAEYIDDITAWAEILKMAPVTLGQFKDWREFALSFIIGRTFWMGEEDPRIKKCCERLLGNPLSPWKFFELE